MKESISDKFVRFAQEQAVMAFLGYLNRKGFRIAEFRRSPGSAVGEWYPVNKTDKDWVGEYSKSNS